MQGGRTNVMALFPQYRVLFCMQILMGNTKLIPAEDFLCAKKAATRAQGTPLYSLTEQDASTMTLGLFKQHYTIQDEEERGGLWTFWSIFPLL